MIPITTRFSLDENEVQYEFVRASGPGGQNVNKVSTAVVLRWDVNNAGLPPEMRKRFEGIAGKRLTTDGILILKGQQYRLQERNRQDTLDRLVAMLREAAVAPVKRIATKPTRGSRIRTLEAKARRSDIKANRQKPRSDD